MSDKWKHDNWHNHQANRQKCGKEEIANCPWCRIRELEAKLDAVEALPQNWRDISYKTTDAYTNLHGCADELEAIIEQGKGDDN